MNKKSGEKRKVLERRITDESDYIYECLVVVWFSHTHTHTPGDEGTH